MDVKKMLAEAIQTQLSEGAYDDLHGLFGKGYSSYGHGPGHKGFHSKSPDVDATRLHAAAQTAGFKYTKKVPGHSGLEHRIYKKAGGPYSEHVATATVDPKTNRVHTFETKSDTARD